MLGSAGPSWFWLPVLVPVSTALGEFAFHLGLPRLRPGYWGMFASALLETSLDKGSCNLHLFHLPSAGRMGQQEC